MLEKYAFYRAEERAGLEKGREGLAKALETLADLRFGTKVYIWRGRRVGSIRRGAGTPS
jgi:hypothetical protein